MEEPAAHTKERAPPGSVNGCNNKALNATEEAVPEFKLVTAFYCVGVIGFVG